MIPSGGPFADRPIHRRSDRRTGDCGIATIVWFSHALLAIRSGHDPAVSRQFNGTAGTAISTHSGDGGIGVGSHSIFASVISIAIAVCTGAFLVFGWTFPKPYRTMPTMDAFIRMCISAPFRKKSFSEALLTVAVLPSLGELGTILLGGVIFSLVHVLGGNPGPDNQIAGFMLGWAFLKSRTILVPIAMHAAGNLIAASVAMSRHGIYIESLITPNDSSWAVCLPFWRPNR